MGRTFGKTITQPAKSLHSATVIVLHGLGDDCHGWEHLGKQLAIDHVKWVYPTGAARPITVNGGQVMPAWFDLRVLGKSDKYCTSTRIRQHIFLLTMPWHEFHRLKSSESKILAYLDLMTVAGSSWWHCGQEI